ncbi:MAG: class I SAM-dependent methyltransferase [Verrucomicrobia bacterium]|nr:class I SAM-dependent methyltransferase [Verrucomicrobiota bacterium]
MSNQSLYGRSDIATGYAGESNLQAPEETILRELIPFLPTAKMLDIGVGGGRTTLHFAKWVSEYVGVDYAERMVEACRRRFAGYPDTISFQVCDARSMEQFEADSFDFVLFSYNGIDCIDHEGRLTVLQEVGRVGKSGGTFAFSSHNLNSAVNFFEWRRMISLDPRRLRRTVKRLFLRFVYNRDVKLGTVRNSAHTLLSDRSYRCKMQHYYIRPLAQIEQLKEHFTDVRVFSLITGSEIKDMAELETVEDNWLYYLCRIK